MATQAEIQTHVNRIQGKIMRLEAVVNDLHQALFILLREFEKHSNLPPGTIRPMDGEPKPKP